MTSSPRPPRAAIRPVSDIDVPAVAAFLHHDLNTRVPAAAWAALLDPPWASAGPNKGFPLVWDEEMVGVYAAVYSVRDYGRQQQAFCNLAAFCVREEFRAQSFQLMRALLAQKGLVFTDFSPSGNVPALNDRLGFVRLDNSTRLVVNAPWFARGSARLTDDHSEIGRALQGADATVFADHRYAPAAHHLLVQDGPRYAYLVFRRDRRKRLRIFATPLYVGGDRALLRSAWPRVMRHLARRGLVFTLAEHRLLGFVPAGIGAALRNPRPKMFKGADVDAAALDYLYSELDLVEW